MAALMIKNGDADGMVSGACHSTANTLTSVLTGYQDQTRNQAGFRILLNGSSGLRSWRVTVHFVFADCGLNQNPNSGRAGCNCSFFRRELQDASTGRGAEGCYAVPFFQGLRKACRC